ncbi:MAG: RNHCP domain-containing protein [Actinomycetota bacterium]|nr:RNHCP domain-containing protein [Actinomycetota bacterium]
MLTREPVPIRSRTPTDHRGAPAGRERRCTHCGRVIPPTSDHSAGEPPGQRGHCPRCLHGTPHDDGPTRCPGALAPIAVAAGAPGEWQLVLRCDGCDRLEAHAVATDDNTLLLVQIAVGPLARPPFPLEPLGDV